jgi:hypothetical protein
MDFLFLLKPRIKITILFNDKFDNGVYFIKVNNTVLKHIIW